MLIKVKIIEGSDVYSGEFATNEEAVEFISNPPHKQMQEEIPEEVIIGTVPEDDLEEGEKGE